MEEIAASIIIPTYNKLSRLKLVLKTLEPQITQGIEVIIVFDGCSEEVILEFQKLSFSFNPIPVILKQNVGRSCARNKGLSLARGKIIIFLDDDRLLGANYIASHLAAHKEKCVVLGMRKETYISEEQLDVFFNDLPRLTHYIKENSYLETGFEFNKNPKHPLRWLSFFTGNVSVEKEDLMKVGGFDEKFKGWGSEDLDLGIRLFNEKIKYIRCKEAVNYHMTHASNFKNKSKELVRNHYYMMTKYKKHPLICLLLWGIAVKQTILGTRTPKQLMKIYKEDVREEI